MPGWDKPPSIHIDLRGGLGKLYGNNIGRMLGALVGLEISIRPLHLRIENPIEDDSLAEVIASTRGLQEFLRFRKMDVALVAGNIDTLEAVQSMAQADVYSVLNVTPARLGGLWRSAEAVLACRAHGQRIMLNTDSGKSARSLQVLSQVALGLHPDFLGASAAGCNNFAQVNGEMQRALMEIEVRGQDWQS